jgi:SNF2-related domain
MDQDEVIVHQDEQVESVPPQAQPQGLHDIGEVIAMTEFIEGFGDGLLYSIRTLNPPQYDGKHVTSRDEILASLKRKPLPGQVETIHAGCTLLMDRGQPACVYNGEMGSGKTIMAIATAAVLHNEGVKRALVISPPHLVYKWRREIKETVPNARVWVLNGPDTLAKLLQIREMQVAPTVPEFFILGRVRMRLGFNWRPVFGVRKVVEDVDGAQSFRAYACCPDCGEVLTRWIDGSEMPMTVDAARITLEEQRGKCDKCGSALWTLMHKGSQRKTQQELVSAALQQLPSIGPKRAAQLLARFGAEMLSGMLADNVYEFINLMDADGELVFNDRQASRLERSFATFEYSVGQGGYQASEFIKRYLPQGYFGLCVGDEGHEFKSGSSAQGQAMGVLARKCQKILLLTGTLMGGYADDLFHLLWRLNPGAMLEDGFKPSRQGSMTTAAMAFMREHGVLKDIYKETGARSHRTSRAKEITHRVAKAPGFGPKGIMRFVLPVTAFLKLKDLGAQVLPPYEEEFEEVPMTEEQSIAYRRMESSLSQQLRQALAQGDGSLLGVVLNVLLAWPDCAFRTESVSHPRSRVTLHLQPAVFKDSDVAPKEARLVEICKAEKAAGRKVLAYSIYTGTRDTTARLKTILEQAGLKVALLRAGVDASKREDWVFDQVERGIDVLLTNPELVKTGLDLLEFPTIVYMQSGYNVYTLQQASRRSWRIGQKKAVKVIFLGYEGSAQIACLRLMGQKIMVSQSTSGDMPDSGLEVLNQSGDSIEVALAKQLVH